MAVRRVNYRRNAVENEDFEGKKMLSSSSYIKLPGIKMVNILKTYRHSISKRVKVTFVYKYLNSQYYKKITREFKTMDTEQNF